MDFLRRRNTFSEAVEALKQGKRIRRASEKKGYVKLSGFDNYFLTYWEGEDKTSTYCVFTLEDIFAQDWLID